MYMWIYILHYIYEYIIHISWGNLVLANIRIMSTVAQNEKRSDGYLLVNLMSFRVSDFFPHSAF